MSDHTMPIRSGGPLSIRYKKTKAKETNKKNPKFFTTLVLFRMLHNE